MELDSFTQKLLERTQARRENINKKIARTGSSPSSKRHREPLSEENFTDDNAMETKEDSQKRKCEEIEISPKRRSVENSKESLKNKENSAKNIQSEDDQLNSETPFMVRGLAALRRKNNDSSVSIQTSTSLPEPKVMHEQTNPSTPIQTVKTRSRLAALARDINQWEDNSNNSSASVCADPSKNLHKPASIPKSPFKNDPKPISINKSPFKNDPKPISIPKSPLKNDPKATQSNPAIPKSPSKNPIQALPGGGGSDKVSDHTKRMGVEFNIGCFGQQEPDLLPHPPKEAVQPQPQVRKIQKWDRAVIDTLESQGFTKSPSASKLTYAYQQPSSQTNIKDRVKMFEQQQNALNPGNKPQTVVKVVKWPPEAVSEDSPIQNVETKIDCTQETTKHVSNLVIPSSAITSTACKIQEKLNTIISSNIPNTTTVPKNIAALPKQTTIDPSNLSLSARRALFESSARSEEPELAPELRSVAERAVLFEKAMTFSPKKKSPAKIELIPQQHNCQSPQKVAISIIPIPSTPPPPPPLPATSGILRKSSSNADDKRPEINAKKTVHFSASPVKNIEMHTKLMQQRLLEGVNRKPENDILEKALTERKNELDALKNRWNKPDSESKCQDEDSDEELEVEISGNSYESEEVPEESSESSLDETNQQNVQFQSKKVLTPQRSYTSEAVAVCDEMDSMLNDALDGKDITSPPRLYPLLPKYDTTPIITSPPKKIYKLPESSSNEIDDLLEEAMEGCSDSEDDKFKSPPKVYPLLTKLEKNPPAKSPSKPSSSKVASNESESPLQHSVSFYRRQKQQLTPVKIIKRVEMVLSPQSPARDSDEFYEDVESKIRQLKEDLHRQDVQVKQTCQALFLCAAKPEFFGSTEHVEGERLLLIASHKRNSYRNFIAQLKTESALGSNRSKDHGTLTISEIRLPLKQEFLTAQLSGHITDAVHYFFCVIRYREKVIATEMLSSKDGITAGTFSFSNHICLQELTSNFAILFEVYALQTSEENSMTHEKKYNIKKDSNKLKLTTKTKKYDSKAKLSPAISSPAPAQSERPSNFDVVGMLRLTLENCRRRVLPMEKVPLQSPLEGRVSVKLQLCTEQPVKERGFLTMFEDVSGFGAWHRRWCVLTGNHLSYWKYPDHEKTEVPINSIDLRQCITPQVGLVSADICARKNTFMLLSVRPQTKGDHNTLVTQNHNTYTTTKHLLSADTKEERIVWCNRLNRALEIIRKWDPEALRPVQMHESNA